MEYRYPKWLPYTLLAFFAVLAGAGLFALGTIPSTPSCMRGEIAFGIAWMLLLALLLIGYFYLRSYCISVNGDAVMIKGSLHTRTIAISSIAQIVTVSTPRGGTDSWLLSEHNKVLAKLDGSLDGFDSLLYDLEQHGRPYQTTVFRRGSSGSWEWRIAGDTHWVSSNGPSLFRKNDQRIRIILLVGFSLMTIMAGIAWWLNQGGFDALL
ncbi:MAG TPA: hypothetical protein VME63_10495 [Dyella sp.]|uniref:hypothetical protein n=1 Tax=Dyella sp. TaxID=1869338 RepID=UPI002BD40F4C|nr:hypothetical protein [Dyella sp.]HTV85829.1 hypothetical protein [Dyella sp.]